MNYASESASGISPVGLVVRLYENIVADLGRAVIAVRDGDIERRTAQMQHALLLIAHLQNALDMQNGGDPARLLDQFYSLSRTRIVDAQLAEGLADVKAGRTVGPFKTHAEFIASLREAARKMSPKKTRRPA